MSTTTLPVSDVRSAFEADIAANPSDLSVALIYADWLEEHGGEPALASLIRSAPGFPGFTPHVVAELLGVSVRAVKRAPHLGCALYWHTNYAACPDHRDWHAAANTRQHSGWDGAAALEVGRRALAWMQAHEADVRAAQAAIEDEDQRAEEARRRQAAHKRAAARFARLVGKPVRAFLGLQGTPYPIHIEDGDAEPALKGRSYYWTTPGGRPVYYPSAYRAAWGKPVYHGSTRHITVGREWLRAQGISIPEGV